MPNGFTGRITDALANKLSSARDATGLSTREVATRLAKRVSISHATIANYEKGRTIPNLEVLALLASLYERPLHWFLESGENLSGVRYRNLKSRVRARDRHWFEAKAQQWLEAYAKLKQRLKRRLKRKFDSFEVSPDEPEEEVAKRVRKQAKIALDAPVPSVVGLRSDDSGEVLHYVVTKRKNGEWVRLEGNYERLPAMPPDFLTDEEWLALEAAYDEVLIARNLGSDNLAYSDSLAKEIGKEFAKRARRVVLPALLFSAIMAKRKRGEWTKLNPKPAVGDIGFSDIDEVAS
jgi:transcriptional regulator with XRE-family HTH domain